MCDSIIPPYFILRPFLSWEKMESLCLGEENQKYAVQTLLDDLFVRNIQAAVPI